MSVVSPPSSESIAWLDVFLDVVHGDVVLGDPCCRVVGDSLVESCEPTLRHLVACGGLPASLEKALDTYCIRHVLLSAPELLLRSKDVGDALLELAQRLRGEADGEALSTIERTVTEANAGPTAVTRASAETETSAADTSALHARVEEGLSRSQPVLGRALEKHIKSLRKRLSTHEYACCMDVLADVVSGYVERAAGELEAAEAVQFEPGAPWVGAPSQQIIAYRQAVRRFAQSVGRHREMRKRAREEAVDKVAAELLFPSPQQHHAQDENAAEEPAPARRSSPVPTPSFAQELRAAMESPEVTPSKVVGAARGPADERSAAAGEESHAAPTRAQTARHVRVLDNSVQRGVKALEESQTPPLAQQQQHRASGTSASTAPDVSTITVDLTGSPDATQGDAPPGRRGAVQVAGTEVSLLNLLDEAGEAVQPKDERDGERVPTGSEEHIASAMAHLTERGFDADVIACVMKRDPEVRTYVLSATTGRFEPAVARGFFQ